MDSLSLTNTEFLGPPPVLKSSLDSPSFFVDFTPAHKNNEAWTWDVILKIQLLDKTFSDLIERGDLKKVDYCSVTYQTIRECPTRTLGKVKFDDSGFLIKIMADGRNRGKLFELFGAYWNGNEEQFAHDMRFLNEARNCLAHGDDGELAEHISGFTHNGKNVVRCISIVKRFLQREIIINKDLWHQRRCLSALEIEDNYERTKERREHIVRALLENKIRIQIPFDIDSTTPAGLHLYRELPIEIQTVIDINARMFISSAVRPTPAAGPHKNAGRDNSAPGPDKNAGREKINAGRGNPTWGPDYNTGRGDPVSGPDRSAGRGNPAWGADNYRGRGYATSGPDRSAGRGYVPGV